MTRILLFLSVLLTTGFCTGGTLDTLEFEARDSGSLFFIDDASADSTGDSDEPALLTTCDFSLSYTRTHHQFDSSTLTPLTPSCRYRIRAPPLNC